MPFAFGNKELSELLSENSSPKKCRKRSFRKHFERGKDIEPACIEQNSIRAHLRNILTQKIQPIEDPHFGIDYAYQGITIDQKFCFGALGKNTIKIRAYERRLINKSDWTMAINAHWIAHLFPTTLLAEYVKTAWGSVQKRRVAKKRMYTEYAVNLNDVYRVMGTSPTYIDFHDDQVLEELIHYITPVTETTTVLSEFAQAKKLFKKIPYTPHEPSFSTTELTPSIEIQPTHFGEEVQTKQ